MINVEFFSGINGLCGFEATGHSMSADSGEDIICFECLLNGSKYRD